MGRLAELVRPYHHDPVAMRAAIAILLVGCASSTAPDPGLEGLAIDRVAPSTIIPGTKLHVRGASFVDEQWGEATLHLSGDGVDLRLPARFVDFSTLTVAIDAGTIAEVGNRDFRGTARVDVVATSDGETYSTDELVVELSFRDKID